MLKARKRQRGFTLIELMIVVAIIGILAVLAVFGVRKYLANAKTAEARNNIGQINQLSIAAYERESQVAELIALGTSGTVNTHQLCADATLVPGGIAQVANKKYQPNPKPGSDFQLGTPVAGWVCLKFEVNAPITYMYWYSGNNGGAPTRTAGATLLATLAAPAGNGWYSEATGDLNGDGTTSNFATGGQITSNANGAAAVPYSQIAEANPEE